MYVFVSELYIKYSPVNIDKKFDEIVLFGISISEYITISIVDDVALFIFNVYAVSFTLNEFDKLKNSWLL